jgi:DNA-binding CsgD family transcriptional regulator
MPDSMSALLLELYRLARASPHAAFHDAALGLIRSGLLFDTASWGMFASGPEGLRTHVAHLYGVPSPLLEAYELEKPHDWSLQRALAEPGRATNENLVQTRDRIPASVLAHCERWGMQHVLSTAMREPEVGLFHALALFRVDPARPFDECERSTLQALMPHLVEALRINTMHFFDDDPAAPRGALRARARIDEHGVVHQAERGLGALIRSEVKSWSGQVVPRAWLDALLSGGEPYRGRALVVSLERRLGDRSLLILVRSICAADRLSPREAAVVRELAFGKTHRTIAEEFGTSPATVRTQIQAAYAKLGVRSKGELGRLLAELE